MPLPRSAKKRLAAQRGSSLAFTVVMLIILLGFLGLAIYVGIVSYVQQELQKATATAAQVGAAATYDGQPDSGRTAPAYSRAKIVLAATNIFNSMTLPSSPVASPLLSYFHARLSTETEPVKVVGDVVTVSSTAQIDTPILAPIGIRTLNLQATGKALYVKSLLPMLRLDPTSTSPTFMRVISLTDPLVDGPGPDLHIKMSTYPYKGYIVEACDDTRCFDIGGQAQPDNPVAFSGKTARVTLNGNTYTAVYGGAYFDLAANGGTVKKAAYLKIMSTGIYDSYTSSSDEGPIRNMELTPQPVIIDGIELYHFSALCPASGACNPPGANYSRMY